MSAIDQLLGLALGAFEIFIQLIVQILDFFLVFFRIILTALHLQ